VLLVSRDSLFCLACARRKVYLSAGKYVHELQTTASRRAKPKFSAEVVSFLNRRNLSRGSLSMAGHSSFLEQEV
jgi:hypothetical protein